MVGGPAGNDLSIAEALYVYDAGGYVTPTIPTTELCQGYWAYFSRPAMLRLAGQPAASATCPVGPGWTMVGNPFTAAAALPADTIAYQWNPDAGRYDRTTTIPVGAAVWIDAPSATSVTLHSGSGGTSGTVVIAPPFSPPYQAHVGDTVELLLPGSMTFTAHADPTYLQFIDSGTTLSYPVTQFWHWRAISSGTTLISADPACRQAKPPCGAPSLGVQVDILP
jgi:hypothetical protein